MSQRGYKGGFKYGGVAGKGGGSGGQQDWLRMVTASWKPKPSVKNAYLRLENTSVFFYLNSKKSAARPSSRQETCESSQGSEQPRSEAEQHDKGLPQQMATDINQPSSAPSAQAPPAANSIQQSLEFEQITSYYQVSEEKLSSEREKKKRNRE